MIEITDRRIDTGEVLSSVESPRAGAAILFVGSTREWTSGRQTASLDYECYRDMAIEKMYELEVEARHRWQLVGCSIVHRIGHLPIGEISVAIAVSSAHRIQAFKAVQWLIDTLKAEVPIWKKENWADGDVEWVHPDGGEPTQVVETS